MPRFKKKYATKKKRYKPYKKNKYSKMSLSKRVSELESAEKQTYTGSASLTDLVATSGNYARLVSNVVQGDDVGNRQGNRIVIKSVNMRLLVSKTTEFKTTGQTYNCPWQTLRVMVVTWKKSQGQTLTPQMIFADNTSNFQTVNSPYNVTNIGNFKVWYDKTYGWDSTTFIGNKAGLPLLIQLSIKPPPKYATAVFTSNAGTAASISENDMYVFFFSGFEVGATHASGGTTVAYTDQLALATKVDWNLKFIG